MNIVIALGFFFFFFCLFSSLFFDLSCHIMFENGLLNTYFSLIQVLLIEFNDLIISYENQLTIRKNVATL